MSIYNYKIEFVYHTLIRYRAMFILTWQCHVDVEEWFSRFLEFIVWFRFVSFRFSLFIFCFVSFLSLQMLLRFVVSRLVSFRFAVFRFCFVSHFTGTPFWWSSSVLCFVVVVLSSFCGFCRMLSASLDCPSVSKFYLKSISIKHITTQALMNFANRLHTKYIHSSHNHAQTHQFNKK